MKFSGNAIELEVLDVGASKEPNPKHARQFMRREGGAARRQIENSIGYVAHVITLGAYNPATVNPDTRYGVGLHLPLGLPGRALLLCIGWPAVAMLRFAHRFDT